MMYQALIVAAGSGSRSGLSYNKNLYLLKNKPMILYSVERFLEDKDCEGVIIVCSESDKDSFSLILEDKARLVIGGTTRQISVSNGLNHIHSKYVLIHDGARPNLKKSAIAAIKAQLSLVDAATLCVVAKDALASVGKGMITHIIDRESTVQIQTPQGFLTSKIIKAHQLAKAHKHKYPDDASLIWSELKEKVAVVPGDSNNIKATTADDFVVLEALL
ncbi:MAG: 2-C-methyl-D-erythritol 4-phosphate cytidylyltransferase [Candidatus Izemoplasmatales bacterium]|jgi:2-C-methyl-D-erythritol 4-phosphate cytidylyltransferase